MFNLLKLILSFYCLILGIAASCSSDQQTQDIMMFLFDYVMEVVVFVMGRFEWKAIRLMHSGENDRKTYIVRLQLKNKL